MFDVKFICRQGIAPGLGVDGGRRTEARCLIRGRAEEHMAAFVWLDTVSSTRSPPYTSTARNTYHVVQYPPSRPWEAARPPLHQLEGFGTRQLPHALFITPDQSGRHAITHDQHERRQLDRGLLYTRFAGASAKHHAGIPPAHPRNIRLD